MTYPIAMPTGKPSSPRPMQIEIPVKNTTYVRKTTTYRESVEIGS
jgi:hypothetical protein